MLQAFPGRLLFPGLARSTQCDAGRIKMSNNEQTPPDDRDTIRIGDLDFVLAPAPPTPARLARSGAILFACFELLPAPRLTYPKS
jgi:hypothetical protein